MFKIIRLQNSHGQLETQKFPCKCMELKRKEKENVFF